MTPPIIDEKQVKTVNKYALAAMVMILTAILTTVMNKLFDSTDDRSADCLEQVMYLRERVTKLEKQLDEYTTAYMVQRGVITKLADSLATKGGSK